MEHKSFLQDQILSNTAIFKLPEGKEPYICICFSNKQEAEATNADLIEKFSKDRYALNIWVATTHKPVLNIMLLSDQNQRLYRNLGFDPHIFSWWLSFTQNNRQISFKFCHTVMEQGKAKLVKTKFTNKPFIFNVHRYNLKEMEGHIM